MLGPPLGAQSKLSCSSTGLPLDEGVIAGKGKVHTYNKSSSDQTLSTSTPALRANPTTDSAAMTTDHRRSFCSHLALALNPLSPALPPTMVIAASTP